MDDAKAEHHHRASPREGRGGTPGDQGNPGAGSTAADRLGEAERAFEQGDFRRVRRLCDELALAAEPEIASAARELRRRVGVDPMQVAVIGGCIVVFVIIVSLYVVK